MRQVAVTEGDKVEAEIKFGYSVNGYGMGDLVKVIDQVGEDEIQELMKVYEASYALAPALKDKGASRSSLHAAAKIFIRP